MTRIVAIDPIAPQPSLITEAVAVLRRGKLVIYPTRCLYGLGADATNAEAVGRVFEAKGRPPTQPLSVIEVNPEAIAAIVRRVTPLAERIMARFWPGAVTIVMEAGDGLPPGLTAGTGKIGVRLPAHPVAAALVTAMGRPITATSANRSGSRGCYRIQDLPPQVLKHVDLVLDSGGLDGGVGSTVVDASGETPRVLREGVVSAAAIFSACGKKCSGESPK